MVIWDEFLGSDKCDKASCRLSGRTCLGFAPFPDSWIPFLLLGPLTIPSWEEASRVPRLPPPVHKTKVPLAMASSLFRVHELPSTQSQSSGPGNGSPERGKLVMVCQGMMRGGLWLWSEHLELRWDKGSGEGPQDDSRADMFLRWRCARIPQAAGGCVSALTSLPGTGLGAAACRGPVALPEEAGTQRVPVLRGGKKG